MRLATSSPKTLTHHRDIATYFAEQNIHPGYLTALLGQTQTQNQESSPLLPLSRQKRWFELLSFSFAVTALILSSVAVILYICTKTQRPQIAAIKAPIAFLPELEISRMEERISRLARAVAIIASSTSLTSDRPSSDQSPSNVHDNIELVEVIVQKANLRIRPDLKASAMMAVSEGSKLVVNDRLEGWTHVFAPSGELLWISNSVTRDLSSL